MKTAIAGSLVVIAALTACQRKAPQPADDGFGAGATPADTTMSDTTRIPATPDTSTNAIPRADSTSRPQ